MIHTLTVEEKVASVRNTHTSSCYHKKNLHATCLQITRMPQWAHCSIDVQEYINIIDKHEWNRWQNTIHFHQLLRVDHFYPQIECQQEAYLSYWSGYTQSSQLLNPKYLNRLTFSPLECRMRPILNPSRNRNIYWHSTKEFLEMKQTIATLTINWSTLNPRGPMRISSTSAASLCDRYEMASCIASIRDFEQNQQIPELEFGRETP